MREFVVYTLLRVLLFAATWGIVAGIWSLFDDGVSLGATFLIAFLLSGVGSYVVLRGPREKLAQHVEVRAARATARFEEARAREDQD